MTFWRLNFQNFTLVLNYALRNLKLTLKANVQFSLVFTSAQLLPCFQSFLMVLILTQYKMILKNFSTPLTVLVLMNTIETLLKTFINNTVVLRKTCHFWTVLSLKEILRIGLEKWKKKCKGLLRLAAWQAQTIALTWVLENSVKSINPKLLCSESKCFGHKKLRSL